MTEKTPHEIATAIVAEAIEGHEGPIDLGKHVLYSRIIALVVLRLEPMVERITNLEHLVTYWQGWADTYKGERNAAREAHASCTTAMEDTDG